MTPEQITKIILNPNQGKMASKKEKKKPLSQTVARKKSTLRRRNHEQVLDHKGDLPAEDQPSKGRKEKRRDREGTAQKREESTYSGENKY